MWKEFKEEQEQQVLVGRSALNGLSGEKKPNC